MKQLPKARLAVVLTCAALVLSGASLATGEKKDKKKLPPPDLPLEHRNPSSTFTFRTPATWKVEVRAGLPEWIEARGDGLIVRILKREGDMGLDSLHVECMEVRLTPPMDAFPQVDYEYDFVGGAHGERRTLDSAFVVHYDAPIDGQVDWRQRNVTIVGEGESVCLIGYAPVKTLKKSKEARILLDAVLGSVEFKKWP